MIFMGNLDVVANLLESQITFTDFKIREIDVVVILIKVDDCIVADFRPFTGKSE